MPAGVYLHIPFCRSRCSYCDFATDVYKSTETVDRYVSALVNEIEAVGVPLLRTGFRKGRASEIDTIYFGGGTPSLLAPNQVGKILDAVHSKFSVASPYEITMEMNPATVTLESLKEYRSLGVDRASFGVQTFDDTELKRLARGHNAEDARTTFRLLRDAGFENISFDLIAGLPRQTLADWERNLDEALALWPEHLSLYLLEIHEGTPLATQVRDGRQPMPDENLAAEMYELMLDKVTDAGYGQYEISNFAKPGFESRHNTKYWRLEPVYGYGVSAHSFDGVQRYANERDTAKYVERIGESTNAEVMRERIDAASEFVFLGLRLNCGIDLAEYKDRFDVDLEEKYSAELRDLQDAGLIEIEGTNLRLTGKGRLFSNEVFRVFI